MADSSVERYTKIPNDILEAIMKLKLSPSQHVVFLYVLRKTYGFQKGLFGDNISINKMAKETGYSRQCITRAVFEMEKKRILLVAHNGSGRVGRMRINDPADWKT